MSGRKLDYGFYPVPKKPHALWAGQTLSIIGLRTKLFELAEGEPIRVYGDDWKESLCKQMEIHGRERPNARKGLIHLESIGLLRAAPSGHVTVLFRHDAELPPLVVDSSASGVDPSSTGNGVVADPSASGQRADIPLEPSVENHSDRVLQTDQTDKKEQTRSYIPGEGAGSVLEFRSARALGFEWLNGVTNCAPSLIGWERAYEAIGLKPVAERALVASHLMQSSYIATERRKAKPDHVLRYWDDFVAGPRNFENFQPAKRYAGPSRVASAAEYAADAATEECPWD